MFSIGNDFNLINLKLDEGAIPLNMIWLDGGEYLSGDHLDWEEDQIYSLGSNVESISKLSSGYWMGQYLITQAQWDAFSNEPLIKIIENNEREISQFNFKKGKNLPLYNVTWVEAMRFCRHLNIEYKDYLPKGYHFSLPTAMQWEYACLGGSKKVVISDDVTSIKKDGPVGQNPANAYGLYDMLGNIRQWCYDILGYWSCYEDEVSNMDEKSWWKGYGAEWRIIRGWWKSSFTEYAPFKYYTKEKKVGFRVCLRPLISHKNCDLDDPLLINQNIKILG